MAATLPAAAETADATPGPALLEASVNGQQSREPMLFLRGTDGTIYAPARFFAHWRLHLPAADPVRFEEEPFYPLTATPGLRVTVSEQEQTVAIEAAPAAFLAQSASLLEAEAMPMTPPGTGAFLNYDVLAERAGGNTALSGLFEAGLFTRHGVGRSSFVAAKGGEDEKVTRLETRWSIDRPGKATSLRIGDSLTFGGPGAVPVRFGGLHYYRNFAVQPGFVTMPLPGGTGSAALPSVVDIYVNNVLQSRREIAPGPFELTNIPVQTGGGTVQIVVRDLLGREVVTEQAYYASSRLLRTGLHDFSYEAGFLRSGFGRVSNGYGAFMASTVHRYGLTDRVTVEANAQASGRTRMAGAGVTFLAFDLGQVGGSVSLSRSERGAGWRAGGSFERSTPGFSFGLRAEFASAAFAYIGRPDDWLPPRREMQAFASLPFRGGAVAANLLHRSRRGAPPETIAGLFGTFRIGRAASAHIFARRVVAGKGETAVGANIAFSFGRSRTVSGGLEHGREGMNGYASLQKDAPPGSGAGYRIAASFGEVRRVEGAYVRNLPAATVTAQASHGRLGTGLRLSASGSVGLLDGDLFAARALGESFAAVRVDGFPGLRVYADDQLVGMTGRKGGLVVPGLRPFHANKIRVEDSDLPVDAQFATLESSIRPYAGTGMVARFAVRRERGVLMQVRLEDGRNLPAGARVQVEGDEESHIAASGGIVYVPGLSGTRTVRAEWPTGRCAFAVRVPDGDDPQPRIEGLVCRAEASP